MSKRTEFIKDIFYNGKKDSWQFYSDKYGFRDGKQANDYYRWFLASGAVEGIWEPSIVFNENTTIIVNEYDSNNNESQNSFEGNANEVELSDGEIASRGGIPVGARITKVWGKPGNYSYAYDLSEKTSSDIKFEILKEFKEFIPSNPYKILERKYNPRTEDDITYLISLPDMHFGKTRIEESIEHFLSAVDALIERAKHHKIRDIIFPIGNDLFHSEGLTQSTTKGTRMFDYVEWKECFSIVWKLLVDKIDSLSTQYDIHIPIILGNHSEAREYYLGCLLEAYYSQKNPNVIVYNNTHPRKYLHFGKVLLGFDHGELKPTEYPLLMATEKPIEFSKSTTRIMLCGHLHSQQNYEIKGVHVRFLPSLCPADEWHNKMGYISQKAAQGYKFNTEGLLGYEEYRI